jgi:hypothetical protein
VRVWAILVGIGVVVGVAIALIVHSLGTPKPSGPQSCDGSILGLGATFSIDGDQAKVGFTAIGPPGAGITPCYVPTMAPSVISLRVTSADGAVLFTKIERTGPPPGSLVTQPTLDSTNTPVAPFCAAQQPLQIEVIALGNSADASVRLTRQGSSCQLG